MRKYVGILGLIFMVIPAPNTQAASYEMDSRVRECDRLASMTEDENRRATGVTFEKLDAPAAITTCTEALRVAPNDPQLNLQMGRAYWKTGDFANAKRHILASGVKLPPDVLATLEQDHVRYEDNMQQQAQAWVDLIQLAAPFFLGGGGGGGGYEGSYCEQNPSFPECRGGYQSAPSAPPPAPTSGFYGNCHGGAAYGC